MLGRDVNTQLYEFGKPGRIRTFNLKALEARIYPIKLPEYISASYGFWLLARITRSRTVVLNELAK